MYKMNLNVSLGIKEINSAFPSAKDFYIEHLKGEDKNLSLFE